MDKELHESTDNKTIPMTSITSGSGQEVLNGVYYYTDQIVNISFIGFPGEGDWVLVDAGLPKAAAEIRSVVVDRFGRDSQPSAVILTHGHFDHVGGLLELVEEWDVPVYAHELELPYLTGEKSYPKPDSTVEGGFLAKISGIYPNEPINIGNAVQALPQDNSVPGLDDWKWIHTPGHSPGHVSFYRENDSLLLSGDAFITVRQDSFYNVLMQTVEVNGPPRYLTTDWQAAKESVEKLEALQPEIVVPGHGSVMKGEELKQGLKKLVQTFDQSAIPDYGRFVDDDKKH
ncbi:Glyoxylase, beta-lactamase superfamily II [Virgibacillus subterraneus]|uniref:Glyoxylase, beta-lactamase superfamily II n=1 Tax=Virgibacillus subterraneus TaxID=621109 RepID=A0A1H9IKH0_9BACI|nr:MBL fold metallo-hydrolase [Virgibacillus subterraneus]SEQ75037.1 Glyoxylase, beta-lactamase superfamily II [Virgibacillus subterraneus]